MKYNKYKTVFLLYVSIGLIIFSTTPSFLFSQADDSPASPHTPASFSSWSQTDWSGGPCQEIWLNSTKYKTDDGYVDVTGSPGNVKLARRYTDSVQVLSREDSFNYWDWHYIPDALPIWGPALGGGTTFETARSFEIPTDAVLISGSLEVSVDDFARIWLNGVRLCGDQADGRFHHGPHTRDISPYLRRGTNRISFDCKNYPSVGWLAAKIEVSFESGGEAKSIVVVSDGDWPGIVESYVDGVSGNDGWDGSRPYWDGNVRGPKKTIGAGIDLIETGGTCYVAAGVYNEKVVLKAGISLMGAGRDICIIDGTGLYVGSGEDRIVLMASNSKLSGFSVINGEFYGVECRGVSAVIEKNFIGHHVGLGVHLLGWGAQWSIVGNNIITDCGGYGAIVGNTVVGSPLVVNNAIVNNRGNGICFWYHGNPIIKNNIITSNNSCGIIVGGNPASGVAVPIISYNDVWNNRDDYVACSPGGGDISADPLLVGYCPIASSPCVDAGDPDPAYNDLDGSRNDMGACGGEGVTGSSGATGTLLSSAYDAGLPVAWKTINWVADRSGETEVKFRTRTAPTLGELDLAPWSAYYTESNSQITSPSNRWIQYEVTLKTRYFGVTPVLNEVAVFYTGAALLPTPTPLVTPTSTITPTPSPTPSVTPTPTVTPSVSCEYIVSGFVLDSSTLEPVPNADVWLEFSDHSTCGSTSATDGSYTIREYVPRPPGTVLVWAGHPDYMTESITTTWECTSYQTGINFELDRIFTPSPSPSPTLTPTPTPTPTSTPTPTAIPICELYPIALDYDLVKDLEPGTELTDIFSGSGPGNFGWIGWRGYSDLPTLCKSLTPPGDSNTYINPDDPDDHEINIGDWISGSTGVMNAKCVRECLDHFIDSGIYIAIPVWDRVEGAGNNARYRTAGFALVQITDYHLPGRNRISAIFHGFTDCSSVTPTPIPQYIAIGSGDYDGDGRSDIAIFRPASGLWSVRGLTRFYFGGGGDMPVSGDYDGDWTTDVAIYRPNSGMWAVRDISRVYFGIADDIPVPGDYDGDGTCDPGIFRSSAGLWAVRDVTRLYFGASSDCPVPADYDGDFVDDVGIFRPASGMWAVRNLTRLYFGGEGDLPVPADYDRDGITDRAVYQPGSGLWAGILSGEGVRRIYFGGIGDITVPADYDGDLADDVGIFRPSSGLWTIRGLTRAYFGGAGDIPVTR